MHCILKTEDKCDGDRTEEMVVCSILGGDLGSNNNSWAHSGSSGYTGIRTAASRLICLPKTYFWLERHLNTMSLVICVPHDLTQQLT